MFGNSFHERMVDLVSDPKFLYSFFLGLLPSLMDIGTDFSFAERWQLWSSIWFIVSTTHHQAGWGRRTDCIRSCLCSHHRAHLWVCHLTLRHNLGEQQGISVSCVLLLHFWWIWCYFSIWVFILSCIYICDVFWHLKLPVIQIDQIGGTSQFFRMNVQHVTWHDGA